MKTINVKKNDTPVTDGLVNVGGLLRRFESAHDNKDRRYGDHKYFRANTAFKFCPMCGLEL